MEGSSGANTRGSSDYRPNYRLQAKLLTLAPAKKASAFEHKPTRARSVLAQRSNAAPRSALSTFPGAPAGSRARKQRNCYHSASPRCTAAPAPARARDAAASTAQHRLPPWAPPPAKNARARVPTPVRVPTPPVRRVAAAHRGRPPPAAHNAACARCEGRRRRRKHTKHNPAAPSTTLTSFATTQVVNSTKASR